MALGKPVIASDCGGNKEIITDGQTGYLVQDNNKMQLVEVLKMLLNDKDQCMKMGQKGKEVIEESFSIEKMVTSYKCLYERLVSP